jgi:hypothetical protein
VTAIAEAKISTPYTNQRQTKACGMKRKPSLHQKQIRFFTVFFGTLLVSGAIVLLWLVNRLPVYAH